MYEIDCDVTGRRSILKINTMKIILFVWSKNKGRATLVIKMKFIGVLKIWVISYNAFSMN